MSPSQQEDLPSPATPAPDLNAVLQTPSYKDAAPCVGVRHLPGTVTCPGGVLAPF